MSTQLGPAWPGRKIAAWMLYLARTTEPVHLKLVTGPEPVRINRDRYPARGSSSIRLRHVVSPSSSMWSWESVGGSGEGWQITPNIGGEHSNEITVTHYGR